MRIGPEDIHKIVENELEEVDVPTPSARREANLALRALVHEAARWRLGDAIFFVGITIGLVAMWILIIVGLDRVLGAFR